jgi:hypothetical protein
MLAARRVRNRNIGALEIGGRHRNDQQESRGRKVSVMAKAARRRTGRALEGEPLEVG